MSLQSPTYGRLWLSVAHHAGDTVSCTQAEAMVLAAEKRSGQQPRRRTELLQKHLEAFIQSREPAEKRLESQRAALAAAQKAKQETTQLRAETDPKRIGVLERRLVRREKAVQLAMKKLGKTQALLSRPCSRKKRCVNGWNSSSVRTLKTQIQLKLVSVLMLVSAHMTTLPC